MASLDATAGEYVETAASPREYLDLFKQTFGPMVAIYASLVHQPERAAALDGFLQYIARWNRSQKGGVRIPYEYLLVVARTART